MQRCCWCQVWIKYKAHTWILDFNIYKIVSRTPKEPENDLLIWATQLSTHGRLQTARSCWEHPTPGHAKKVDVGHAKRVKAPELRRSLEYGLILPHLHMAPNWAEALVGGCHSHPFPPLPGHPCHPRRDGASRRPRGRRAPRSSGRGAWGSPRDPLPSSRKRPMAMGG